MQPPPPLSSSSKPPASAGLPVVSERVDEAPVSTVWVFAASPQVEPLVDLPWIPRPDRVVCADGGTGLAATLGITPDLVIGDLDSSDSALLARLEQSGVAFERYEHTKKLETDTELAVFAALRWEPARIVIFGAIGGRLDHALANVLMLTHPALWGLDVSIVEGQQEVFLAKAGQWNEVHGRPSDLLSLLPVGVDALGVRTDGLVYPLNGETLPVGRGRGVSNELEGEEARVWLDEGKLLVVVGHR